jgi:hypothetical protein
MNITPLTKIFIKNIMFRSKNKLLSIMNEEDVILSVTKAYEAMQPRTFKKITTTAKINNSSKKLLFKNIAKYIVDYFNNPSFDFDAWHHETCDKILNELNTLLTNAGYQAVKYGKAQKILNVTFKLLYLYDDANTFNHLFKNCHFILDDANLNWYNGITGSKIGAWSNLKYEEYMDIQINIRKILMSQIKYPQNPFEAEFYIWADYQF